MVISIIPPLSGGLGKRDLSSKNANAQVCVCVFPNNVEMKSFLKRLGDLNSAVASACFVFSFGSCAFEPFEELRFL